LLGVGSGNWPVVYPKFAPVNDPSLAEGTGMTANPWPSSDWVAALSERGFSAFLGLAAFVVLLLGAAVRMRNDATASPEERLAAVAGGAVVLIAALEGAFDAVLLLPTPTIVVMSAAGALIGTGGDLNTFWPLPMRRLLLGAGFGAFMLIACVMGNRRIEAMRLYEIGSAPALEAALAKDPGSYRIQLHAAEYYLTKGQCNKARPHARAARGLFPHAWAPARILAKCGERTD
jgi:hypothetical protein